MSDAVLFRVLGIAALTGGILRIGSSFIPWDASDPKIEGLAFVIDVALLFGLMGIYLAARERLGWIGFAAFALAETGIASIVGPDGVAFGIDTYLAGVHAISVGLAVLGIVMLTVRVEVVAAICWVASLVIGLAGGFVGQAAIAFLIGGVLFGLGFVAAGLALAIPAAKSH